MFHIRSRHLTVSSPTRTNPDKTMPLNQGDYGLSKSAQNTTLAMCYQGGRFKSKEELEEAIGEPIIQLHFTSLKFHIKSNIGPNKRLQGIPIPNKNIPKYVHQSLPQCVKSAKNGSKAYRKILRREIAPISKCNLSKRWNKRLSINTISESLIKHSLKLIYNKCIPHKYGDLKARITLGKTQFNNQLAHHKGHERDKFCDHCKKDNAENTPTEDVEHVLFTCPSVNPIYCHHIKRCNLWSYEQQ